LGSRIRLARDDSSGTHAGRANTLFGLPSLWIYLVVSLMFTGLYHQITIDWSGDDYAAFVRLSQDYTFSVPLFRFRVLTPLLGRLLAYIVPVNLVWIFRALTTAFVFGSLVAYRKYLSNFMRADFATLFSIALIYPMIWNLCLLNRLCLPFDVPSVMFFILGCHFIYRRNWRAYYPVLALASLNRETSCFLIVVFLLSMWGEMNKRTLAAHLLAQVSLWMATKCLLYAAMGPDQRVLSTFRFGMNVQCLRDILVLQNNGLKDLIKLALCCGGIYWFIPWLLHGQPRFVRRSLFAAVPFLCVAMVMHLIDEMRSYLEVIPLVLTPLVYRMASDLGGVIRSNSTSRDP
jgi:hypothetical protein